MAKTKSQEDVVKAFNQEAENRSNRSNIRCLLIMACMLLLCEILNEIGVFQVVPLVMRIGTACGAICYLTPVIVLSRPSVFFIKILRAYTTVRGTNTLLLLSPGSEQLPPA